MNPTLFSEPRPRAIGKTIAGRYVFPVFTWRTRLGERRLRPISARYMHQHEAVHDENQIEKAAKARH